MARPVGAQAPGMMADRRRHINRRLQPLAAAAAGRCHTATMPVPHVIVIGCGFGGLEAVRALSRADVEVTLVDRTNHHLFQPLLYQVATAGLSAPAVSAPIRHILRREMRRGRLTVLQAEVPAIDVAGRAALLDDGTRLAYDHVIVAAGATNHWFGRDDWAAHAPGLKTLADAFDIRARLIGAFEQAERCSDPAARDAWLNFVVIGGGPTGVELAGTLVEIARHTLPDEFRRIDSRRARVQLVEGGPRVLAAFDEVPCPPAHVNSWNAWAWRCRPASAWWPSTPRASRWKAHGLQRLPARTVLWAAGVAAVPLGRQLAQACGLQPDRTGRVPVQVDLSVAGHAEISVIGDLAAATSRRPPGARRQPGGQADGALRRRQRAGAHPRAAAAGLPLRRLRGPGHAGPQGGGGAAAAAPGHAALRRLPGVAVLAVCARVLPDRLPQPAGGADRLGLELLDLCPPCACGGAGLPAAADGQT
jgi:NADH dehydrogenase